MSSGLVKRVRGLSNLGEEDNLYSIVLQGDSDDSIEIYKGTKNFWRLRKNVDFNFEYRRKHDIIEIIGYDVDNEVTAPRLYANASTLIRKCQNNEAFTKMLNNKKVDFAKRRASKATSEADFIAGLVRSWIAEYLLQRLDVVVSQPLSPQGVSGTEFFEPLSPATDNKNPDPISKLSISPKKSTFALKFNAMGSDTLVPVVNSSNISNQSVAHHESAFKPVDSRKCLDFEVLTRPDEIVETYIPRRKKTKYVWLLWM